MLVLEPKVKGTFKTAGSLKKKQGLTFDDKRLDLTNVYLVVIMITCRKEIKLLF
jgi:hypothetical protein